MSALDKVVDALTPLESPEKRTEARAEARKAAQPGDWLSTILDHHEQIEQAFAQAKACTDAAACKLALKRLGELLNGHSMAEEAVIYPAMAQVGKSGHADTAYAQQVAAKLETAALEKLDPTSEDFRDKLGHLEGAVVHHVYKEESDWFLDLKRDADPATQAMMLERYNEEYGRYMRGGEMMASGKASGEPRSFASDRDASPPPLTS